MAHPSLNISILNDFHSGLNFYDLNCLVNFKIVACSPGDEICSHVLPEMLSDRIPFIGFEWIYPCKKGC